MKSPTAYYILLLYITVLLKPILPVIQDMWAHAFDESYHLHHVHDKFGSHHLEKELANTSSENHGNNQSTLKTEDQVPFHTLPSITQDFFSVSTTNKSYILPALGKLPSILLSLQVPPPKFL